MKRDDDELLGALAPRPPRTHSRRAKRRTRPSPCARSRRGADDTEGRSRSTGRALQRPGYGPGARQQRSVVKLQYVANRTAGRLAGPWPLPGPRRSATRGREGARVRRLGARGRDRPTPRWLAAGRGSAALEDDPLARAWRRARPRGAHSPRSRRDGAGSRDAARVGGDRPSQHGSPPRARGHPRAGRCGPAPAPRSRVREARSAGAEPGGGHPDARLPHGGRPPAGAGAGARGAALRRARRDSRAAHWDPGGWSRSRIRSRPRIGRRSFGCS